MPDNEVTGKNARIVACADLLSRIVLNRFDTDARTFAPREAVRKTDIDFDCKPWSSEQVEQFRKSVESIENAYIFGGNLVHANVIEEVDNGVEEFVARLSELYEKHGEHLKMIGVLRYGTQRAHFKYFALCVNRSDSISHSEVEECMTWAFRKRCLTLMCDSELTAAEFADKYAKFATENTDYNALDCGFALLTYGLETTRKDKNNG